MTPYSKLVAAALGIALLVLSAAAQPSCSRAGMGKHDSYAAMVGMVSSPLRFAASAGGACCEMSPAEGVATPLLQLSGSSAASAVPPVASSIFRAPRTAGYPWHRALWPRVPRPPAQALLCVFLI